MHTTRTEMNDWRRRQPLTVTLLHPISGWQIGDQWGPYDCYEIPVSVKWYDESLGTLFTRYVGNRHDTGTEPDIPLPRPVVPAMGHTFKQQLNCERCGTHWQIHQLEQLRCGLYRPLEHA